MRYLCLYKPAKKEGVPPNPQEMAEMGKLIEDMTREGILLATEGCTPTAMGAKVRLADGKFTVSDGPFTEAKEIVGGFAILDVKSKADIIEQTKRFLKVAGDGETEIRKLYSPEDFAPPCAG